MPKNILIFADGTGNESGLLFDERRTNVYKLYRATRNGPDTTIDPNNQIAIYVSGVGTLGAPTAGLLKKFWKEIVKASVGVGLTAQVIDCYAAIINCWEPGDRIYLFGFSRGAYAARCVACILEAIGIPQAGADGVTALSFEPRALRRTAKAAVKLRYRLGLPKRTTERVKKIIGYFQTNRNCKTWKIDSSVLPYSVCVFDSVGAIGWMHFVSFKLFRKFPFVQNDYDMHFPPNIIFARHALAIDEYRKDFARVLWGGTSTPDGDFEGIQRFNQIWFAGNHSDIGGGYPDGESRLSDVTLDWIAKFISEELPKNARVEINKDLLRRFASCKGMMHDELMVGKTPANIHIWGSAHERRIEPEGGLHDTVLERLSLPIVRNFIGYGKYRPKALADHSKAKPFYK